MVRGIANSKIGFGDLILLLRYFFKLKVSTHPNQQAIFDHTDNVLTIDQVEKQPVEFGLLYNFEQLAHAVHQLELRINELVRDIPMKKHIFLAF